jgi:hypothetical protein
MDKVEVKKCEFCGQSHSLTPYKNVAGDEVIKCPSSGKVVCSDYYED